MYAVSVQWMQGSLMLVRQLAASRVHRFERSAPTPEIQRIRMALSHTAAYLHESAGRHGVIGTPVRLIPACSTHAAKPGVPSRTLRGSWSRGATERGTLSEADLPPAASPTSGVLHARCEARRALRTAAGAEAWRRRNVQRLDRGGSGN